MLLMRKDDNLNKSKRGKSNMILAEIRDVRVAR
jgi:hypothetical protein